jgi:hypothetical protein
MVHNFVRFNLNGVRLDLFENGIDHIRQEYQKLSSYTNKKFLLLKLVMRNILVSISSSVITPTLIVI